MDIYHNIYYDKKSKSFYYYKKNKHINIKKSFKNEEDVIEFTKILNENNDLTNKRINNIYNLKFNKYNTEFKYIYDNKKWICMYYLEGKQKQKSFDNEDEAIKFNEEIIDNKLKIIKNKLNDNQTIVFNKKHKNISYDKKKEFNIRKLFKNEDDVKEFKKILNENSFKQKQEKKPFDNENEPIKFNKEIIDNNLKIVKDKLNDNQIIVKYKNIYYDKNNKLFYYRKKTKHINIRKSFKTEKEAIEFKKILNENNDLTNEKINNIYNLKFKYRYIK